MVNNIATILSKQATSTDIHNLQMLWGKKSGEKLYVDENNRLQKMGFFQKIPYSTSSGYQVKIQANVKKVIDELTAKIEIEENPERSKLENIQTLFFQKLSHLSRKVYSRTLSEKTYTLLLENENGTVNKINLWAKMGNFSSLGGSSGSYKIIQGKVIGKAGFNEEKPLGIFKPSSEEVLSANNPKFMTRLKRLIHLTLLKPVSGSLFHTAAGQSYLAEVASKKVEQFVVRAVDDYLENSPNISESTKKLLTNIKLVPQTEVATLKLGQRKEEIGSFQVWVDDTSFDEAYKALGVRGDNYKQNHYFGKPLKLDEMKKDLPKELFELLVIIDYTTGNSDRHGKNWFIVYDENKNIAGIRLIDGGWSMAPDHPQNRLSPELTKQYIWKNLPHAEKTFSPSGQHVIAYLKEHQEVLAQDLEALYFGHSRFEDIDTDAKRIERMKERIEVLERYSEQGKTLRELANVRTEAEITTARTQIAKPLHFHIPPPPRSTREFVFAR